MVEKVSDTFSRFDTIPAVTDSQPASQPATSHVAVAITLNAMASSLITVFLGGSDVSAGSSLSVPQLTAVHCHYPVFLLTILPFLK